jgi:cysteinyl-tRNA synthetase
VQDELREHYRADIEVLQTRIDVAAAEAAQSQQAFETYRDRSKQALLKSAADQRSMEAALAAMKDNVQVHVCCYL